MKHVSLRRRLLIILIGLTTITWLVSVSVTAVYSSATVRQQIDLMLTYYADLRYYTFDAMQSNPAVQSYFSDQSQVIERAGEVTRIQGINEQGKDLAPNYWVGRNQYVVGEDSPRFSFPQEEGLVTTEINGVPWRLLYRKYPDKDVWLAVGVNLHKVDTFGIFSIWSIIFPLVVFLPIVLAVVLWGVNRGLRPVSILADRITSRSPNVLDAVEESGVPLELLPIVRSLNGLLYTLQRALESEKRFTANAAHELRTPLAAIQAEVQGVERQFSDSGTREIIARIAERVDRASETLRQLLTLAHLDSDQNFDRQDVDLSDTLMDEITDLGDLAVARNLEFELTGFAEPVIVRGNTEWLRILAENILLNAIKYSTHGSKLAVTIRNRQAGPELSIGNDCEPIPESELECLTETFYRCPGNNGEGTGVGLSIVKRIADLHDARLDIGPWQQSRGVLVRIIFGSSVQS